MTHRRHRQAGVTLVEMLVVIVIIGAMASVTVLSLRALDRGVSAEAEAMRLADRLQEAADEAMMTSGPLALIWDERGYQFLAWDAGGARWRQSRHRDLGHPHNLPAAFRLERDGADAAAPIVIAADLPQPPVVLRIAGRDQRWRVVFDGYGASAAPMGN